SAAEQSAGRASSARGSVPAQRARSSTAVRVAIEVAKQTRALRQTTKILFVLLILVAIGFGALQWKTGHDRDLQFAAIQAVADSAGPLSRAGRRGGGAARGRGRRLFNPKKRPWRAPRGGPGGKPTPPRRGGGAPRQSGDPATIARLRTALDAAVARQRNLNGA